MSVEEVGVWLAYLGLVGEKVSQDDEMGCRCTEQGWSTTAVMESPSYLCAVVESRFGILDCLGWWSLAGVGPRLGCVPRLQDAAAAMAIRCCGSRWDLADLYHEFWAGFPPWRSALGGGDAPTCGGHDR